METLFWKRITFWNWPISFCQGAYYMWHRAMKRLIPAMFIHLLLSELIHKEE